MNGTLYKKYTAFAICVFIYFFEYVLYAIPNVLSQELLAEFKLTMEDFSSLGYIATFTYAIMQIPAGILIDKFNLRKVVFASLVLVTSGGTFMAEANTLQIMQLGRLILALGSCTTYGVIMKIAFQSFPTSKCSIFLGIASAIGSLGPNAAQLTFDNLSDSTNWRYALLLVSLLGLFLLFLSYIYIDNIEYQDADEINEKALKGIIRNKSFLIYTFFTGLIYTSSSVIADIYGALFFESKFRINTDDASAISLSIYIGGFFGSLIIPYISDKFKKPELTSTLTIVGTILVFIILLLKDNSENIHAFLTFCMVTIGVLSGITITYYSLGLKFIKQKYIGLASGIMGTISMSIDSLCQYIVGYLIDLNWDGTMNPDGSRIYTADNFVTGLSFIPVMLTVCFMVNLFMIKSTKAAIKKSL